MDKIEELIEPKRKSSKVPLILAAAVALVLGIVAAYVRIMNKDPDLTDVQTASVPQASERVKNTGVKTDSEAYLNAARAEDAKKAEEAEAAGGSILPQLLTGLEKPVEQPKEELPPPPPPPPAPPPPPPPPPYQYTHQGTVNILDAWLPETIYAPGKIEVSEKMSLARPESSRDIPDEKTSDMKEKVVITPGTTLYAIVDVGANSDQPGTPVTARVVSGEYDGAVFIGGFQRQDEKLVLQFNKMVWDNPKLKEGKRTYAVSAYAIDPDKLTPGVASNVNTHFWSRWGGLVAASFLEGLADAKSRSGTTYSYNNANNNSHFTNDYSPEDQAWIAAGKVGQRVANQMEQNFNRPPTVTLTSGTAIGILIL